MQRREAGAKPRRLGMLAQCQLRSVELARRFGDRFQGLAALGAEALRGAARQSVVVLAR